jgi:alanine dehydrogenase
MIIGVPKEVKADEYRVGLLPVGAHLLTADGHTVLVEKDAGLGSGFADKDYGGAGAEIVATGSEVYSRAELILKVKEPQVSELGNLRPGQILFCFFHFAASRELTAACLKSGVTAVAYETLEDARGRLPLLTPMSEIAGKMSVQEGAKFLKNRWAGEEYCWVASPALRRKRPGPRRRRRRQQRRTHRRRHRRKCHHHGYRPQPPSLSSTK